MSSVGPRWLILVHAIPPKPDYLRAKVGRRLARIGAVALKNSVYLLPRSPEGLEDLTWVQREVVAGGGECSVAEGNFVGGHSDDDLVALFQAARDRDYGEIADEASRLQSTTSTMEDESTADRLPAELARLRRRLQELASIDFFRAPSAERAGAELRKLEGAIRGREKSSAPDLAVTVDRGSVWVTRRDIHVDRIASAWLIRRFIDTDASFLFISADEYVHTPNHRRFDMFDGEFTHEGPRCTFETLLVRFGLHDAALSAIGEIVHDIDLKERAFGRAETEGVARLLDGLAQMYGDDEDRVVQGRVLFDALYAAFGAPLP